MKKTITIVLATIAMVACGNKADKQQENSDSIQVAVVEDTITIPGEQILPDSKFQKADVAAAIAAVREVYLAHFRSLEDDSDDLGENVSASLSELLKKCSDKQIKTEDIFFDCDYMISAQDFHNLKLLSIEYVGEDENQVILDVKIENMDEETTITVAVVKEADGKWKIDNFIDRPNEIDLRQSAEEFLAD